MHITKDTVELKQKKLKEKKVRIKDIPEDGKIDNTEEERPKSKKSLLKKPFCKVGSEVEIEQSWCISSSCDPQFLWCIIILLGCLK